MLTSIGHVVGHDFGEDPDVAPVDVFLEKPVPVKLLIETVDQLLQGKEKESC